MSDTEPTVDTESEIDVTQAWQATNDQKAKAKKLRLMAGGSWFVAIAKEIAAIVALKKNTFDSGGLVLLIGLLVVIAIFAILGSILWKKSNRHARRRAQSLSNSSSKTNSARLLQLSPFYRSSP